MSLAVAACCIALASPLGVSTALVLGGSVHDKAAALLHSTVRNHALVDGNKRLGLAAVIAFHGMNGFRLTLTNDEAYELVMAVARGDLDAVGPLAERLAASTRTHH